MLESRITGVRVFILSLCLLGIGLSVSPSVNPEPAYAEPTANLIAHWRFSEGSGTFIADSSGNGHHGTAVATSWTGAADVPSLDPHALQFNGSSSYVDTADFDINDDFAISAWIKPNSNGSQAILMKHTAGGGNLIMLGLYSGKYFFRIRDKFFYGPPVHTGEWIHVALSAYKEIAGPTEIERVSLYLNGAFIDQYAMLTEVGDVSGGKAWTIGQDWDGDTRTDFFDGAIDDVRIYDGELLPPEVKALSEGHTAICKLYPGTEPDLNYAAGSGVCDEVILATGTYPAGNIIPSNDVSVRGNQASDTFVDITGAASKRFVSNLHHAVTLQKMTIRNGDIQGGGLGGAIYNEAAMSLSDLVLTNNETDSDGGAIYNSGHITLSNVVIHDNRASNGGGFANASLGKALLDNVHIWDNNGSGGGGILNTHALTITDSLIEKNKSANSGGGLLNYGTLSLVDSEVRANEAVGQGGGLYNDDFSDFVGTAIVRTSRFYSNTADGSGGGVANAGTLTLDRSTVSDNNAGNDGGGVYNSQLALRIDINGSTISDNHAGSQGAGLSSGADANVTNSTVSGNHRTSSGDGAGVYSTASMSLTHVTITDNTGASVGSANALWTSGGTLKAYNTLIVDNGGGSINCAMNGTSVSQAGSLSDDGSCAGFGEAPSAVVMPLADNGGPTQTHALPPNSPAQDAASSDYCETLDQRGEVRGSSCDVGAVEFMGLSRLFLPYVVR